MKNYFSLKKNMFIQISWGILIIGYAVFTFTLNKKKSFISIIISSLLLVFGMWFTFNYSKTFWHKANYEFHLDNETIIYGSEVKQDFWGEIWFVKDVNDISIIHQFNQNNINTISIKQ